MMVNSSQALYEKATLLMNVMRKHLCGSLFFNNLSCPQAKQRLLHRYFPVSFPKFFRMLFLQHLWVTASTKYLFLLATSTSARNFFP